MSGRSYLGIPRDKIPWKPSIDSDVCTGCGQCLENCPNGVYKINSETGKPEVVDPDNCVVLCKTCTSLCPVGAISFPDMEKTKKLVAELLSKQPTKES